MSGTLKLPWARLSLIVAAILWSLGSVFMRILTEPLGLGLDHPHLSPLLIAFYRGVFGGATMLLLVRPKEIVFRPLMLVMVVAFSAMSALYLSALGSGAAANAIFLQNTAPVWVYLFATLILKEPGDRRSWQSVLLTGLGAVVIVAGGWPRALAPEQQHREILVLLMGLGSGVIYAVVVLLLRALRNDSSAWLIALNLLGSALTIGLLIWATSGSTLFMSWMLAPSARQLVTLLLLGAIQMAMPYWLFARGLRVVSSQEAAMITLIEPLLNPLWAYWLTPAKDTPTGSMISGGLLILAGLIWRYRPGLGNVSQPVDREGQGRAAVGKHSAP